MILLAHWPSEALDLDLTCFGRERAGGHVLAPKGVERPEEADRKGTGRPEPGSGRDVGDTDHLDSRPDRVPTKDLPHDWMLDLLDGVDSLESRVLEEVVVGEGAVHGNEDVPVDRGRNHRGAMAIRVGRQIGPSTSEADSQRGSGDDHVVAISVSRRPSTRSARTAAASSLNITTVSAKTSSRSRPRPPTFFKRSWVTVMM